MDTETTARLCAETLETCQTNRAAVYKYQGSHPELGNLYRVDGDNNFYGWTYAELKAAEKKTGVSIRIAD